MESMWERKHHKTADYSKLGTKIHYEQEKDRLSEGNTERKFLNLQEKRQVHDAVFLNKVLHKQFANITEQYLKYVPTSCRKTYDSQTQHQQI